jgi:hypothetical protein
MVGNVAGFAEELLRSARGEVAVSGGDCALANAVCSNAGISTTEKAS